MARRRHTPEQIIRKLREADRMLGEGKDLADPVPDGSQQARQPVPAEVKFFAAEHAVPILSLKKADRSRWDERKLDRNVPVRSVPSALRSFE